MDEYVRIIQLEENILSLNKQLENLTKINGKLFNYFNDKYPDEMRTFLLEE
jgi:hypothetical protein